MLRELQLLDENFPVAIRKSLAQAVVRGCENAFNLGRQFGTDLFDEAVSSMRRLCVESELRNLVLGPEIRASVGRTPSTTYTRLDAGKVVLTAATRSREVAWVVPYPYRETLARGVNKSLFAEDEAEQGKLFALLIYGGERGLKFPTLSRICFPLPSGHLLPDAFDLLREFPDLATEVSDSAETADRTPTPQIRLRFADDDEEKKLS